jgi:predicted DNA binding protein
MALQYICGSMICVVDIRNSQTAHVVGEMVYSNSTIVWLYICGSMICVVDIRNSQTAHIVGGMTYGNCTIAWLYICSSMTCVVDIRYSQQHMYWERWRTIIAT